MISIRLREMMEAHHARTGEKLTYQVLAERTGISRAALESMASREGYNASLTTIERICLALHCTPGELLQLEGDDGAERARR